MTVVAAVTILKLQQRNMPDYLVDGSGASSFTALLPFDLTPYPVTRAERLQKKGEGYFLSSGTVLWDTADKETPQFMPKPLRFEDLAEWQVPHFLDTFSGFVF